MLFVKILIFYFFTLSLSYAQTPTVRPNLCESVQDFAVKVNVQKNLVVLYNPKNDLMSIFECENETNNCRAFFYGSKNNYCGFEVAHRTQALREMGLMNVVNNVYSISNGSALSKIFEAKDLVGNSRQVLNKKNVETCYDLISLLSILKGTSWQNETANLSVDHTNLMQLTSFGSNLPVLSSVVAVVNALERNKNSGLLAESVLSRRRLQRSLSNSIKIVPTSRREFRVEKNNNAKHDICFLMDVPVQRNQIRPLQNRDGSGSRATN